MREFANPVLLGRGGAPVSVPPVWDRKSGGDMVPVTPRRLILMACYTMRDGRPDDLAFSRKTNKVLDQLESQEMEGFDRLCIDTENLEHIRPWVNVDVAKVWAVDAPAIIDGFDNVLRASGAEPSSDGNEAGQSAALLGVKAPPDADPKVGSKGF